MIQRDLALKAALKSKLLHDKRKFQDLRNWIIQDQSKLIEDKEQIATIFNSFFLNSVQCLARKFGARLGVPEPINNETPVFTIENVSETTVLKIMDNLKGTRSKDVYDIDARFSKLINHFFANL